MIRKHLLKIQVNKSNEDKWDKIRRGTNAQKYGEE
jgi:hypothetical protein